MRKFTPVFLPEELAPKGSVSATFGRFFNVCRRAAYLYQLHRRVELSTDFLERGSALHRILELSTLHAIEQGEETIPPEVVKDIANDVLADPEYWCPVEEHDFIRESAYRWASERLFRLDEIAGVETLFELDLGPLVLRCKIDLCELFEGGTRAAIDDYKSSRNLPTQEDVGRKRDDGTIAAKDFQLVAYALALVFGYPVRVSVCPTCGGVGEFEDERPPNQGMVIRCAACNGRGEVEEREPFRLGERVQHVDVRYVFPGIEGGDDLMGTRGASLTILELHEYLESFRAFAAQVVGAVETGRWPASFGSHCTECPSPLECPIPPTLRKHAGVINTREQAAEAAERWASLQTMQAATRKEILTFVKNQPMGQDFLLYGRDQIIEYVRGTAVEVNRNGLIEASRRMAEFGEPFDEGDFIKERPSVTVKDRKLTEAELEERARRDDHGRRDGDDGAAGGGSGDGRGDGLEPGAGGGVGGG